VPKQGPAWQRWLTRHLRQHELPGGVTADVPALLEAEDAPWVERVGARLSNVMDGATADDILPVVAWEWACCSPPYLWERDPHFRHQDARTERRVREASCILVSASQVESTQIHVSARRDYYVPTPTWWSAMEVPYGFPASMPRVAAYFGTEFRRGESSPAAAILATQWVLEVAGVWYASARSKLYLWHLLADCGSFYKLPGPPRGLGFGKTCVSLVRVRLPQAGPIGCSPPHAPLEGSFHVWPWGSLDTLPRGPSHATALGGCCVTGHDPSPAHAGGSCHP